MECTTRTNSPARCSVYPPPASSGALRVLFIVDPLRRAVFLVGGDKTGQWNRWYAEMIPIAEELYDRYLQDEGLI